MVETQATSPSNSTRREETDPQNVLRRWPAEWVNVIGDGSQLLLAMLAGNGSDVVHAVWTRSPALAWIVHNTFANELIHANLFREIDSGADAETIRATLEHSRRYLALEAPGYFRLLQQLGHDVPPDKKGHEP